jgi:hypothetical protein
MGIITRFLFGESDQPKVARNFGHPDHEEGTETEAVFVDSTQFCDENGTTDNTLQIIQMSRKRRYRNDY